MAESQSTDFSYFDNGFFTKRHARESRSKAKSYQKKPGSAAIVLVPHSASVKFREKALWLQQQGKISKSIGMFTQAIAMAHDGSESRGLAYEGRSALLLSHGLYKESAEDAKLALSNGLPKTTQYKLHCRLAICFREMGQLELAEEQYQKCLEMFSGLFSSGAKREGANSKVKEEYEKDRQPSTPWVWVEYSAAPAVSYGAWENLPSVSSAVEMKNGKFVANRKIEIGDVLSVEEPTVFQLFEDTTGPSVAILKDFVYFRCFHCLKVSYNLTPCDFCIYAMFCSEECRRTAWDEYHKVECCIRSKFPHIVKDDVEVFSIRIVSIFGVKNCILAIRNPESAPKSLQDLLELSEKYSSPNAAFVSRAKNAALLIAGCFKLSASDRKTLVDFILKATSMMRYSALHTQNLYHVQSDTFGVEDQPYACGFYFFHSCMPHSCVPNCTKVVYGAKTVAIIALKSIQPGENLSLSIYGDIRSLNVAARRKRLMEKDSDQVCICEACFNNWNPGDYFGENPQLHGNQRLNDLLADLFASRELHLFNRGLAYLADENLFKKCAMMLDLALEIGVPQLDYSFARYQDMLEMHFQYNAQKFNLDGRGERYVFPSDRDMAEELKNKIAHYEMVTMVYR